MKLWSGKRNNLNPKQLKKVQPNFYVSWFFLGEIVSPAPTTISPSIRPQVTLMVSIYPHFCQHCLPPGIV